MPNPSETVSSGLLHRVRSRDPEAWERLARLYGPLVYRWARQAGLQDADAADVTQTVFANVARSIDGFDRRNGNGTFRGWLWTIARNEVRKTFNRKRDDAQPAGGNTAQALLGQLPDWVDDDAHAEPPGFDGRTSVAHRALDLARNEFEPSTWTMFWRTCIDEQPATAVADELETTAGAVRQAKYRVLCRLRVLLDGN